MWFTSFLSFSLLSTHNLSLSHDLFSPSPKPQWFPPDSRNDPASRGTTTPFSSALLLVLMWWCLISEPPPPFAYWVRWLLMRAQRSLHLASLERLLRPCILWPGYPPLYPTTPWVLIGAIRYPLMPASSHALLWPWSPLGLPSLPIVSEVLLSGKQGWELIPPVLVRHALVSQSSTMYFLAVATLLW